MRLEEPGGIDLRARAEVHITLTRPNLAEGEACGPVHAPFFPHEKFEVWCPRSGVASLGKPRGS